jgi:hypothetical protein
MPFIAELLSECEFVLVDKWHVKLAINVFPNGTLIHDLNVYSRGGK